MVQSFFDTIVSILLFIPYILSFSADPNYQPPKSPMNLADSMNLIFDIIVKLLTEKFAITLPTFWGLTHIDFTKEDIEHWFSSK